MIRPPPTSTLFPYTTLFRSVNVQSPSLAVYGAAYKIVRFDTPRKVDVQTVALNNVPRFNELFPLYEMEWKYVERSEEHTSELQSLRHLVCRLLLEKKKYTAF